MRLKLTIFIGTLLCSSSLFAHNEQQLNVAYFSQDPPSVDPLSPAFDPDSYAVIAQIFDPLIKFDLDGTIQPALALRWERESDTRWRFWLRKGVKFHNGERFDARSVKFTFDYILNPANKAGNAWIFSSLKQVSYDPNQPYQVVFETHFPDGMFLYRLNMFSSVCPADFITKHGIEHFAKKPIGTGPYRFKEWQQGVAIQLTKNPTYWEPNIPFYQQLTFKTLPQEQWIQALLDEEVDFIPNLQGKYTTALLAQGGDKVKVLKRLVLSSYWVLIKNQGILANKEIRQALNYAVNKADIIRFADAGNGKPMASLGKQGEFGKNPNLKPYLYNPNSARKIIAAHNAQGTELTMLASDIAESAARIIKSNLEAVGLKINLTVVSRSEWAKKVVGYKLINKKLPPYDLVVNLVDNPIYNLAFHAGLFLHSASPWALLDDPEYDKLFEYSLQTVNHQEHEKRLQLLDKYIHDNALMVFTSQRIITAAVSSHIEIDKFGLNGHLDYDVLTNAKAIEHAQDQ